jgi:hypothetical protein
MAYTITGSGVSYDYATLSSGGTLISYTKPDTTSWEARDFTSNGTLGVSAPGYVDYLIVGAGGSSGLHGDDGYGSHASGAGGGGEVLRGTIYVPAGSYGIVVAATAASADVSANYSQFLTLIAIGGGNGRHRSYPVGWANGANGGGGAILNNEPGTGKPGSGFAGGVGTNGWAGSGGGGGAAGKGTDQFGDGPVTQGGAGIFSAINGTSIEFGKGGRGGSHGSTANAPANMGQGADGQIQGSAVRPLGGSGRVVIAVKVG